MNPEFSIIIRTKNEERWIGHCLKMLFEQTIQDFEVIIVDNGSIDHTLQIANRYPIGSIVYVDQFFPGHALNEGIRASHGNYIVCLSAHCVPKDEFWLENLRKNFYKEKKLAGVYGRQLPVSFTNPIDKRDLLTVFGQEYRLQMRDYFFHNANSIIRRTVWEKFPFDELVTNIEDRVWGRQVIEAGYTLAYEPEAIVYHHHGLNQGNDVKRASGVVSILENVDPDSLNELPKSMLPNNVEVAAILPIGYHENLTKEALKLIEIAINSLSNSEYVTSIYLVCDESLFHLFPECNWINRREIKEIDSLSIDQLLQNTLHFIEKKECYPELILYLNYEYLKRPEGICDQLIIEALQKGLDTIFPAYKDYGHFWYIGDNGDYIQTDKSMKSRSERDPTYRALYGQGTVTSAHLIRKGLIVGDRVGIYPLKDLTFTYKLRPF